MKYRNDPFWLPARFPGVCAAKSCGKAFGRGALIFYYPRTKTAYGPCCAEDAERRFLSEAMDEDLYNGSAL